jgi:hypothetical protein
VKTLGIDLASLPKNTAYCVIRWGRKVAVEPPVVGREADGRPLTDELLLARMNEPGIAKIGIDAPFGWPAEFVRAVSSHHDLKGWTGGGAERPSDRAHLRLRATDRSAEATYSPLSVSSDWIAVLAMRCAHLLDELAATEGPVDRAGDGRVCEVYPAAALVRWGLRKRRYAAGQRPSPTQILAALEERLGATLDEDVRNACLDERAGSHALDSLVAALVARAVWCGRTDSPADHELARREGWLHLPEPDSLDKLAGCRPRRAAVRRS